ncbi:MAG: leucine-rich repeat protein [Lachnospiraceae bacterium]|nr:leucine-rich repeat protein [Lachnospiraceae bacterium]
MTPGRLENTGTSLEIPGEVSGIGTESYKVTEIGKEAFEGQKLQSVTLPESITRIDKEAFKDTGMTQLKIEGSVTKGLLQKNSLKGCGTKKNGKGLTILAESKKDQKKLMKQLKKAGVKKAKVKTDG